MYFELKNRRLYMNTSRVVASFRVGVYPTRNEMGKEAGRQVEEKIIELLKHKEQIRMVFAAAPSQNELLDYLAGSKMIPWNRIIAFHMDEYIGLSPESQNSFACFLKEKLFNKVDFKKVHLLNGMNTADKEVNRYASLLKQAPIDIICLGIGENGHIAFNDPDMANFNDPETVKTVTLDNLCRQQQVNEGCFSSLNMVPEKAITLTIPTLLSASFLFCIVPGERKREAVYKTLFGPIEKTCPASILRTHPSCNYFLDTEAYKGYDFNGL